MPRLLCLALVIAALCPSSPAPAEEAIVPAGVIRPFAEPGLAAFTSWLKETKHDDPKGVFRLEDGVLRCGDEDMGYVATKQAYRDYQVSVEYRWGRKRAKPTSVRNTGLLLNAVGPDGSAKGVWMTCVECQLAQGCEGDLIVIPGTKADGTKFPATITSDTRVAEDKNTRWDPHGRPTTYSGKQFWWSRHQPFFKEDYDARGKDDVASPVGEWTKVECRCAGSRITVRINGQIVNECRDVVPAAGKILLQSEGDEVFFRNLEIRPLPAE